MMNLAKSQNYLLTTAAAAAAVQPFAILILLKEGERREGRQINAPRNYHLEELTSSASAAPM